MLGHPGSAGWDGGVGVGGAREVTLCNLDTTSIRSLPWTTYNTKYPRPWTWRCDQEPYRARSPRESSLGGPLLIAPRAEPEALASREGLRSGTEKDEPANSPPQPPGAVLVSVLPMHRARPSAGSCGAPVCDSMYSTSSTSLWRAPAALGKRLQLRLSPPVSGEGIGCPSVKAVSTRTGELESGLLFSLSLTQQAV